MTQRVEPKARYVTRESRRRLTEDLGLPTEDWMQDWPIEVSDPARLDEFLAYYESHVLSDDDRFAAMELIIASFDECEPSKMVSAWPRIREMLVRRLELHAFSIFYWSDFDEETGLEDFRATPFVRELRQKVSG